jgi:N utilization substance protein A
MGTKAKSKNELRAADIVQALGSVVKEKSITMDLVLDTLKDALATAAKKYLNKPINIEVDIDREKGTIEVYSRQIVVDDVEDEEKQIHIDEAQKIESDLKAGDELIQDLDIAAFGRAAISTAKQVLVQRVREAEREKIFADYSNRISELVTGTVQQIDKGNILVNLGRTEALLPYKEQIHKERYRQGQAIRGCIIEVKNNPKGPQIIISRTNPAFLERLFELEVPEIYEGIVRIIKVVRAPGFRAKVAVTSSDSRVDPVGACVGMRGNRVQAIVRELSNERMDIINWTDEMSMLVRRVFSPAEVKRALPVGENKLVVIIKEEDLAQAIGKEGQNIRLASRMLDKEIDVYGDEEFGAFSNEDRERALSEEPLEEEEGAEGEAAAESGEGAVVVAEGAAEGEEAAVGDAEQAQPGQEEENAEGDEQKAAAADAEEGSPPSEGEATEGGEEELKPAADTEPEAQPVSEEAPLENAEEAEAHGADEQKREDITEEAARQEPGEAVGEDGAEEPELQAAVEEVREEIAEEPEQQPATEAGETQNETAAEAEHQEPGDEPQTPEDKAD